MAALSQLTGWIFDVPRRYPQDRGHSDAALRVGAVVARATAIFSGPIPSTSPISARETVQLKTRHWRITDANGRLQEVKGPGVVGEEPLLKPGESFEYTSGVPLPTPSGFMTGSYGMVTAAGEHFDIEIPAFSLDSSSRRSGRSTSARTASGRQPLKRSSACRGSTASTAPACAKSCSAMTCGSGSATQPAVPSRPAARCG